tara:strand:+ start:243 stop:596 length:354 start_codon:yes stop_codon:yes gene_type:complete
MKKRYEKYCPGCGKTYKSDTSEEVIDAKVVAEYVEHQRQVNKKQHTINEMLIDSVESLIVAEIDSNTIKHYEQGVADAEANEEPRPFKQMQGKKWTSEKEYMNDYVPSTDIKDIGKE